MNRSPPPYQGQTTIERILDRLADIYLACKGIVQEIEDWNTRPVRGQIYVNGVASTMTTPTTPTDIPDNDVPCNVVWSDRFGDVDPNATTTWSTEDQNGADGSAMVTVVPDPANSEQGTVTFHAGAGVFRVLAHTQGANGPVDAPSGYYNIAPGAPAVGQITIQ